jgi:hypothetical protein
MARMGRQMGKRTWSTLLAKAPGAIRKSPAPKGMPPDFWRSKATALFGKAKAARKTDKRKPTPPKAPPSDATNLSVATHSPPDGPTRPPADSTPN